MTITVSQVDTVADVPPAQWAPLAAAAPLYQSHPWLRWAEDYYDLPTRYVLVRDAGGSLLGAVVTYLMRAVPDRLTRWYDPVRMFLAPHCDPGEAAGRWFPVLLVGGCSGYHSTVLHHPRLDPAGRTAVVRALLAGCRAVAEEYACGSLAFMYAAEYACDEVIAALRVPACKILTSANTAITIGSEVDDFTGFLDRFPRARRKNLRREVREYAAAGGRVVVRQLGEVLPRVAPLMGAHQRKYGDLVTDGQMAHYLRLQDAHLAEASTVFVDERDGEIRGFTLYYAHGDTLYSRAGGFDPERAAPYAYFNLSVYAPIRHATERGFTTLDLGLGSYRAKRLRGADVTPLWSVVVPPERLEPEWRRVLGQPSPQAIVAGVAS